MTSKKLTYPVVTFSHSLEMETRRVLHLAGSLVQRWYQNHDFLVLPTLPTKVPTAAIVFPNLPYATIPRFWSRVSKLKLTTPIISPISLLSATTNLLSPHYSSRIYDTHATRLRSAWEAVAPKYWSQLFTIFPTYRSHIKQVNIYLTLYGPYTTFNLSQGDNSTLIIFARSDCTVDQLMWTICTCLFRPIMQKELKMTWCEIESAIDWLLHESSLSPGLSLFSLTIKNQRNPQIAKYRQASTTYLSHLGLDQVSAWAQTDHGLTYGAIPITGLTAREQLLLEVLFAKRGVTVTYDDLADNLWPKGDNFSLFAISKEIERLRRKLYGLGIHGPVILAHRKIGYSLV